MNLYDYKRETRPISTLEGLTLTGVENVGGEVIIFTVNDGRKFVMHHSQDCCETVRIEDICGNLKWLVGSPIIRASEDTNSGQETDGYGDTFTWTFYNIASAKGHVTIRWYGTSNGYYSESVDFEELLEKRYNLT